MFPSHTRENRMPGGMDREHWHEMGQRYHQRNRAKYSRMNQVKYVGDRIYKIEGIQIF